MNRFLKRVIAASSLLAVMSLAGCKEPAKNTGNKKRL